MIYWAVECQFIHLFQEHVFSVYLMQSTIFNTLTILSSILKFLIGG